MEVAKYLSFSLDLFEELRCLSEDEQNAVRNCVVEATIDVLQSSVFYSSLHGRVLLCEEDVELGVLQYIRAQEHKKWWCTKGPWRQLNLLTEDDCTFGVKEAPPVVPAQQAAAEDVGDEDEEDVEDDVEDDDEDEEGEEDGEEDQPAEEGVQQNNEEDADIPQAEVETPPHAFDEEVGPDEGEQLVEVDGADALQTEGGAEQEQALPPLQEPADTVAAAADPNPATPVEAAVTELAPAPAPGSVAAEHTASQQPAYAEPPVPEPDDPAQPLLTEPMAVEGVEEIPGIANVVQQVVQAAQALQAAEQALQVAQQAMQAEVPAAGPTDAPGGAAASAADAAAEDSSSEWSAGQGYGSDSDSDFSGNTEGTYDSDCWEMDSDDGEHEDDGEGENPEQGSADAASASDLMDTGGVISGDAASGTSASAADVNQKAAGELLAQHLPSSAPDTTAAGNPTTSLPEESGDTTAQAATATQLAPAAEGALAMSEGIGAESAPAQTSASQSPLLSSGLPSFAAALAADAQGPVSLAAPVTPAAAPADDPDSTAASWLEIAEQIRALDTPPQWIPILSSADVAAVLWDELLLQCDWHTWFFRDMIEQVRSQMPGAAQGSAGYYVPLGAGLEPQFGFDRMVTIDSVVVLMPLLNFVFWNAVLAVRGDARSVFALPLWGKRWAFVDLLRELKMGLPGIPITVSSNTNSSACGTEDVRDQGDRSGDSNKSDEEASGGQGGQHMGGADISEGECEEEHAESTCAAGDVRSSSQVASDAIQAAPPLYVAAEAKHTAAPGASLQPGGSSPSSVGDGAKKGSARAATALLPMMAVFCEPFLCAAIAAYLM